MHYTGTIWRPPYEAESLLLEVSAGCTHHRCKFCTLYHDLPFSFKKTPLSVIEEDLNEAKTQLSLWGEAHTVRRVFLTGANPFVFPSARLLEIAEQIKTRFPKVESIGCFARVTDVSPKSDAQLAQLQAAGYDGLTLGIETGDDAALAFMDKGYRSPNAGVWIRRASATTSSIWPGSPARAGERSGRGLRRSSATSSIPGASAAVCSPCIRNPGSTRRSRPDGGRRRGSWRSIRS